MKPTARTLSCLALASAFWLLASPLSAQTPRVRLTQAIDNSQRVQLPGNVRPQATPANDRGAAPDALPMNRMLLVLKRSPEQQLALDQLLVDQQSPDSPRYHHWLTPQQFGQQFGPAPEDIATISQWLSGQGFTVNRVAPGGGSIEFSGTAGAVRNAFGASIHRFAINGTDRWANATNPSIPAALAPVVAGVASLNNIPHRAGHRTGQGTGTARTALDQATPSLNLSGGQHAMVPGDFATIYNVNPLYTASVNGQGQTIAVVGRTDVNMSDISDFRKLFVPSNPTNLPTVFLNGSDPGDIGGADEGESDLDLEWSGAVAPNATIDFVVSASTDTTDGVDLSAEYIVDNNLAPIMSMSYSACEQALGQNEMTFLGELDQEAAAQGITIVVSSGDSGAAECDPNDGSESAATNGLGVNGLASTPYNVAVGGSEFNEGNNSGAYWAGTNSAQNFSSALGPIPETTWNESCLSVASGGAGLANCDSSAPLSASGGGASLFFQKPAWQATTITGVPAADNARDLPDVAFSAAGHDGYVVCQGRSCQPNTPVGTNTVCGNSLGAGQFCFFVFAGTSASAPSFAGVMAMVNQKTGGLQGQANYSLYALAAAEQSSPGWSACNTASTTAGASCVFLDTTVGNNDVPCATGSASCNNGVLAGYSAHTGYDQVTGLGSINVANLVNGWAGATHLAATSTTLNISPASFTHGASVSVNSIVSQNGSSVNALPSGSVALIAQNTHCTNCQSVDVYTLAQGGSSCGTSSCVKNAPETALPGGTYSAVARYSGDQFFAASTSPSFSLTVTPEASQTLVQAAEFTSTGSEVAVRSANYGDFIQLDACVEGSADIARGNGCGQSGDIPSGTVQFLNNGVAFTPPGYSSGTLALNSEAAADFPNGITALPPGTYSLGASYSGDNSFNASTAAAISLTIAKAATTSTITKTTVTGSTLTVNATVNTQSLGSAPTGTLTIMNGTTALGSGTVNGSNDPNTGLASSTVTVTVPNAPSGQLNITAVYAGDTNYSGSTSPASTINVGVGFSLALSTSTATVSAGGSAGSTITLTSNNGFAGTVALSCSGLSAGVTCGFNPTSATLTAGGTATAALTISTTTSAALPAAPWRLPTVPSAPWEYATLGLLAAGLAALHRRRRLLISGLILGIALSAAACGGGSSGGGGSTGPQPTNDLITVTGTSGTTTASQTFTLTIN